MSQENLESEVARLRAENEALKARTQRRGGQLRVSDKGGVSVYGLGRFPVTLYKEQWRRLLDMADEIRAFIREHESELKSKDCLRAPGHAVGRRCGPGLAAAPSEAHAEPEDGTVHGHVPPEPADAGPGRVVLEPAPCTPPGRPTRAPRPATCTRAAP